MGRILLLLIVSVITASSAWAQQITTLDFVKFVEGKSVEARYFYENNWAAFRSHAKVSEWIEDYHILDAAHPDWDIILVTNYADSMQFRLVEERFAQWRENNPVKLMSAEFPADIRMIVQDLVTTSNPVISNENWEPSAGCSSDSHRAFDFWIGSWIVTRADGSFAGINTIEPIQGGCALQENWTSSNGSYHGTSYNFFNSATGTWHQTWVDNQGGVLQLSGGINEGNMILKSESMVQSDGSIHIDKITWTPNPDGSVVQRWEKSTDNGSTWTDIFHGKYTRAL